MKKSERVLRLLKFLVAFPLAIIYSIGWGRHQEANANVVINWMIIIVQNCLIYYICLWEKEQKGVEASPEFNKWQRRINSSRWTTSILSGNIFFFIVASIWFRLATLFLGLENKPRRYVLGLVLAMAGKGYTERWLGLAVGWAWGQLALLVRLILSLL